MITRVLPHSDTPDGQAENSSRDRRAGERARYLVVTDGARTLRGGTVVCDPSRGHLLLNGRPLACEGDVVEYADGERATIATGTGTTMKCFGTPVVLAGARVDNGDLIAYEARPRLWVIIERGQSTSQFERSPQ